MDEPTPAPRATREPTDNTGRRLIHHIMVATMAALPLVFRYPGQGSYRLTMVDVVFSLVLATLPGVVVGMLGLHLLEPEGEDQAARDESGRQITQMWAAGLGSALLTLVLRLSISGLQASSRLHWFGGLALMTGGSWLGAAGGMMTRADPRRLNQHLPNMIIAAAVTTGVAVIIAFVIAWTTLADIAANTQ